MMMGFYRLWEPFCLLWCIIIIILIIRHEKSTGRALEKTLRVSKRLPYICGEFR